MIYAREDLNVDQLKDLARKVQTFSGATSLHSDEVELIEWAVRALEKHSLELAELEGEIDGLHEELSDLEIELVNKERTLDSLEEEIFDLELQVKDFKDMTLDAFNLKSKTVSQLKEQLREKGLKVSGTKDELIERLKKA